MNPIPASSLKANALTNLAVMGLGIAITFFLTPRMLHFLGEERFGMWTLTSSLVGYFGLLQFGLTGSVFRYVPHYRSKGDLGRVGGVVSTSIAFYCAVGIALVAIVFLTDVQLASFFGGGKELGSLIVVVSLAFAVDLPGTIINAAVKGYEGFALVNVVSAVSLVLRGALLMGCIWLNYDLIAMGWSLVAVRLVALLGNWIAFRRTCVGVKLGLRFVTKSELRVLLVFGGVILIASTANALAVEAPKQIVGKFISLDMLGIFGIPVMIMGYFRQVVFTLTRVLAPRFSYLAGGEKQSEFRHLFLRSSRYVAIVVAGLSVVAWVAGPSFLLLWTHHSKMEQAIPVLLVLIIGNAVLLSHRVSADLLLSGGRERVFAALESGEAVAILCLTIPLAVRFGMVGAAWGMAIPFIVVWGLIQPLAVCRFVGVHVTAYYSKCVSVAWTVGLSLALLAWVCGAGLFASTWPRLILVSALIAGAYFICAFTLMLTHQERRSFLDWLKSQTRFARQ